MTEKANVAEDDFWLLSYRPTVTAKITNVDMVEDWNKDSDSSVTRYYYATRVFVAYEIDGKTYESVDLATGFEGGTGAFENVEREIAEWSAKGEVEIHYNPEFPVQISIAPGMLYLFALIPLGIGIIFWLITYLVARKR